MWLSDLSKGLRVIFRGVDGNQYTGHLLAWNATHANVLIDNPEWPDMHVHTPISGLQPAGEQTGLTAIEVVDHITPQAIIHQGLTPGSNCLAG